MIGNTMRHRQCLIIGYGNPLRGDDGFGLAVAEQLQETLDPESGFVIACQQLVPELAEPISRADVVIFVDARVGEPAGLVECERLRPAPLSPTATVHHADPKGLLALARGLYGATPNRAFLLTVRTLHFWYSESLSPEVRKAIPEAVERIQKILHR
ncbi:MAG: hydrogenase maturation protease [Armatimonadota bacterium]